VIVNIAATGNATDSTVFTSSRSSDQGSEQVMAKDQEQALVIRVVCGTLCGRVDDEVSP
jgi:hypothetical protein